MSNGFEEAKGRRNALERLGEKIPGYRGFADRELRREVDKLQREHLAERLERLTGKLREGARAYTDAGAIAALTPFDRLERRLDGMARSVRFADYGTSGFFDAVKIYDEELARLYELDLSLLEDLAALEAAVAAVPPPGAGEPAPVLDAARARLAAMEGKWAGRGDVVSGVVRTS